MLFEHSATSDFEAALGTSPDDPPESIKDTKAKQNSSRRSSNLRASAGSSSELSSGVRSTTQSTGTSPELPRVSSSNQQPTLSRILADSANVDSSYRERMRDNRPTARSSISSSSSMSISPVESKEDFSKQARDLLDTFVLDATRQTPLSLLREQTSRPHSLAMPLLRTNTISGPIPAYFQSPEGDAAGFMGAVRRPGAPEGPVTPSSSMPTILPNIGNYHNATPVGLLGQNNAAFLPGIAPAPILYGTRPPVGMRMNSNHMTRVEPNERPPLSYPAQSFLHRPSSVPLQEVVTHNQPYVPTQAATGPSFEQPSTKTSLVSPNSSSISNPGISPAASVPRNVPHAPQLLALFHEPPSVS